MYDFLIFLAFFLSFIIVLSFPQDILIPLRDRAFSWDVSLENVLHGAGDLAAVASEANAALLVRHNQNQPSSSSYLKENKHEGIPPAPSASNLKLDALHIKAEHDSIFDADVSEFFDESLLHPNLIDPINNPLPDVKTEINSSSTSSNAQSKPKITIKFNDKLLKQESESKAAESQSTQPSQSLHSMHMNQQVNQKLLEKINTTPSSSSLLEGGSSSESKRVIQSPHMVPLASLSSNTASSSSSGPASLYMNTSLNKISSSSALNDYSSSSFSSSIPSLKRSISAPSGKELGVDANSTSSMRSISSYAYNDVLSIQTNGLNSSTSGPQTLPNLNGQRCSPNFDSGSYLLINGNNPQINGTLERRVGAYTIEERRMKIEKFRERKRQRIWRKQIKYDCRKRLADTRPR